MENGNGGGWGFGLLDETFQGGAGEGAIGPTAEQTYYMGGDIPIPPGANTETVQEWPFGAGDIEEMAEESKGDKGLQFDPGMFAQVISGLGSIINTVGNTAGMAARTVRDVKAAFRDPPQPTNPSKPLLRTGTAGGWKINGWAPILVGGLVLAAVAAKRGR